MYIFDILTRIRSLVFDGVRLGVLFTHYAYPDCDDYDYDHVYITVGSLALMNRDYDT